jgi:hypothetical protein
MGYSAVPSAEVDVAEASEDGLATATFAVSPRRHVSPPPAPLHADAEQVASPFSSPYHHQRRHSTTSAGLPAGEHSALFNQRPAPRLIRGRDSMTDLELTGHLDGSAGFDRLPRTLDRPRSDLSSVPRFEPPGLPDGTGELGGSVFDYYSIQADTRDPRPGVSPPPTFVDIPAFTDENDTLKRAPEPPPGNLDGQLLPEDAELLRRMIDEQRRMLQEHEGKMREQHGELVELTEQKRNLETQMEANLNHVVKVTSQEKKRLSEWIAALEQEKMHVVNDNRKLQGLVNDKNNELQGRSGLPSTRPRILS